MKWKIWPPPPTFDLLPTGLVIYLRNKSIFNLKYRQCDFNKSGEIWYMLKCPTEIEHQSFGNNHSAEEPHNISTGNKQMTFLEGRWHTYDINLMQMKGLDVINTYLLNRRWCIYQFINGKLWMHGPPRPVANCETCFIHYYHVAHCRYGELPVLNSSNTNVLLYVCPKPLELLYLCKVYIHLVYWNVLLRQVLVNFFWDLE